MTRGVGRESGRRFAAVNERGEGRKRNFNTGVDNGGSDDKIRLPLKALTSAVRGAYGVATFANLRWLGGVLTVFFDKWIVG